MAEDSHYPTPPDLSAAELAHRKAMARRVGCIIALVCVLLAAAAAAAMLRLDPGDGGAIGDDRMIAEATSVFESFVTSE